MSWSKRFVGPMGSNLPSDSPASTQILGQAGVTGCMSQVADSQHVAERTRSGSRIVKPKSRSFSPVQGTILSAFNSLPDQGVTADPPACGGKIDGKKKPPLVPCERPSGTRHCSGSLTPVFRIPLQSPANRGMGLRAADVLKEGSPAGVCRFAELNAHHEHSRGGSILPDGPPRIKRGWRLLAGGRGRTFILTRPPLEAFAA